MFVSKGTGPSAPKTDKVTDKVGTDTPKDPSIRLPTGGDGKFRPEWSMGGGSGADKTFDPNELDHVNPSMTCSCFICVLLTNYR